MVKTRVGRYLGDMWKVLGYSEQPDYLIRNDLDGNHHGFSEMDLISHKRESLESIGLEFIQGKPIKIWWPLDRSGPLR